MATNRSSGIILPAANEEVFSNPLYEVLRTEFEPLLKSALAGTPLIVLPSKSVLIRVGKKIYTTRKFVEAHILQSAHIPGLFCSGRGYGVELINDRLISTALDGTRHSVAILQSETLFDFSLSFRAVIVDKPMDYSVWLQIFADTARNFSESEVSAKDGGGGGGPSEWLAYCPLIENDYFEKLVKFKKTYILAAGFEKYFAQRIREMASNGASALLRYLPPTANASLPIVLADIERVSYATLHSHLMMHFSKTVPVSDNFERNLRSADMETVLRELEAPIDLLAVHVRVRNMLSEVDEEFRNLDTRAITPQQKINGLSRIVDILNSVLVEVGIPHCSSEHLIAAMTIALMHANMVRAPIHAAHMDMFLSSHPELAKASFAVATFHSSLEFLTKAII